MLKRLKSWLRTWTKLALLILGYFWVGGIYKLVYAQTHDLTRFKNDLPISYYQQQFLLDALLNQTWILGPDFKDYIGVLPDLGTIGSIIGGGNPQAVLADYFKERERRLSSLPERYPHSLYAEEALEDAYLLSQVTAMFSLMGTREQPRAVLAGREGEGEWQQTGIPDFERSSELARRLADGYPDSPQAPQALLRVAQAQGGSPADRQETYRRLAREYPRAAEAEEAANALYETARNEGRLEEARDYRRRALAAAEQNARERFPGRALPARNTLTLLGFRVDLSGLDLRLQRVPSARTLMAEATRDAERLKAIPALDEDSKRKLRREREQLERVRNELWVADLFEKLKVGVPGPPPRPKEYPVTGRVVLGDRPLPGVHVLLAEGRISMRHGPSALGQLGQVRYRAVSDRKGRYSIPGVPPGAYSLLLMYPSRPAEAGGAPVLPVEAADQVPAQVAVVDKGVALPPARFRKALVTRTFGELNAAGKAVPLEWNAHPGAASYHVEVLAEGEGAQLFMARVEEPKREAFMRRPMIWEATTKATRAEVPLLPLAPDLPQAAQAMQYRYLVTALDGQGKELARSAVELGRFHLSASARKVMMEMKPPTRGEGRMRGPRFRRPRRERREDR